MYQQLKDSMSTHGYDDRFPLDIMLCRNFGIQDTLNQGHHRMGVAIDCNIQRVSVMFSAAGQAPRFLHPLFRVTARFNLVVQTVISKMRPPMKKKIIHVSNFNLLRLKGCFQVGFPFKISNGLIRAGYSVLNYPDRDLCRMFGFGHMNFIGQNRLNKHLINYCKMTEPDAIVIGHADLIRTDTLLEIKKLFPQLKIMQWSCDWIMPGYAERNIKALTSRLEAVDLTMVTTGDKKLLQQFSRPGKAASYLPNIADDSIETGRAFETETLPYDIMLCANTGKRQFCGTDRRS